MESDRRGADRLRVLTSFPPPRATTNPYIAQLAAALAEEPEVEVIYFSWRRALTRRYDVLHAHWPETWVQGRNTTRHVIRLALTTLLCLRLWSTRTPIVRTWHNLELPSGLWRADYVVLGLVDRLTRLRIRINDSTEMPPGTPYVTIPHGHYRAWFQGRARNDAVPRHVAFVGRIRRYKGVEHLVEVVRSVPQDDLHLTVAGLPSSAELEKLVTDLANGDPRIDLQFGYVDDATFVATVTGSSLVVLPYRHMHNSGTALAALSLDRPVLMPDNDVNRSLAAEVGEGWVHLYQGELSGETLVSVVDDVSRRGGTRSPDLAARTWESAGRQHLAAYRQAVELSRRG